MSANLAILWALSSGTFRLVRPAGIASSTSPHRQRPGLGMGARSAVFFQSPPTSEAEQDAWAKNPRLSRRTRALTDQPIVRYLGRDSIEETVEGWRPWTAVVADWLREGRSPTVFLHTPDNDDAPALARRFHDDVRTLVPGLDPLPEPEPVEPATLF